MTVLDWLQQLLGGGDPEAQGAAAASTAMQPAVQQLGQLGPAWQPDTYDPGRSLAQNVLDPRGLENALNVALGVGPGAIKAYHGSPYDFNAFDASKIGTGEGAQAYGHGLYFAENEGVARGYRDALAPPPAFGDQIGNAADLVKRFGSETDALTALQSALAANPKLQVEIDAIKSGAYKDWKPSGRMYEVNINAEPDQFLNWDKPLSEQPQPVQEALKPFYGEVTTRPIGNNPTLGELHDLLVNGQSVGAFPKSALEGKDLTQVAMAHDPRTGGSIYESQRIVPGAYRDPAAASQTLQGAGIPGIRYLDQGSRGAGQGTSNYVVFDPSIIEILRKYGIIPPAVGAGLLGAADQQ